MKNIVTITLIVLGVLFLGVLTKYFLGNTEQLPRYLPSTISTKQQLALFQANAVPVTKTVSIGPSEEEEVEFNVISTQGQYLNEDRKMTLTVSVEEIGSDEEFGLYKEKAWQRYTEPSRGGTSTQMTINDHDVYLSFRTLEENTDTKGMVVMGGGYVFFPENNVAVTYSLLNTRLHACEDIWKPETCQYDTEKELPTIEDARLVAEQILSNFLGTGE